MLLAPYQNPRAILTREFASGDIGSVVRVEAQIQIVGVTDIEFTGWIFQNVGPKHNSKRRL
jgi:hypothetical protein